MPHYQQKHTYPKKEVYDNYEVINNFKKNNNNLSNKEKFKVEREIQREFKFKLAGLLFFFIVLLYSPVHAGNYNFSYCVVMDGNSRTTQVKLTSNTVNTDKEFMYIGGEFCKYNSTEFRNANGSYKAKISYNNYDIYYLRTGILFYNSSKSYFFTNDYSLAYSTYDYIIKHC